MKPLRGFSIRRAPCPDGFDISRPRLQTNCLLPSAHCLLFYGLAATTAVDVLRAGARDGRGARPRVAGAGGAAGGAAPGGARAGGAVARAGGSGGALRVLGDARRALLGGRRG